MREKQGRKGVKGRDEWSLGENRVNEGNFKSGIGTKLLSPSLII